MIGKTPLYINGDFIYKYLHTFLLFVHMDTHSI